MLVCMRTTMNLPDALLEQVKQRAAAAGQTVTSVMEQALRQLLSEPPNPPASEAKWLPTYGNVGAEPLVDLTDRDAVWAALPEQP